MPLKRGKSRATISTNRAYAAGLIDGEGSISASPSRHSPHNYRVRVAVGMCDYGPVAWLAETFGGKVSVPANTTKTGKAIFVWALHCRKAADFLELILPYLKVKQTRAVNAIALARRTQPRGVRAPVTVDELAARRSLAHKIRAENFGSNGRIASYAVAKRIEPEGGEPQHIRDGAVRLSAAGGRRGGVE